MSWVVMDVRAMAFPDASFDVVLDKGAGRVPPGPERTPIALTDRARAHSRSGSVAPGTLDALFAETRSDPWNPSPELCQRVHQ